MIDAKDRNRLRLEGFREGFGLALMFYGLLFVGAEWWLHGWDMAQLLAVLK